MGGVRDLKTINLSLKKYKNIKEMMDAIEKRHGGHMFGSPRVRDIINNGGIEEFNDLVDRDVDVIFIDPRDFRFFETCRYCDFVREMEADYGLDHLTLSVFPALMLNLNIDDFMGLTVILTNQLEYSDPVSCSRIPFKFQIDLDDDFLPRVGMIGIDDNSEIDLRKTYLFMRVRGGI